MTTDSPDINPDAPDAPVKPYQQAANAPAVADIPDDPPPPVITDEEGRTWMLFDGFQIAPHSDGKSVLVIFGYRGNSNIVIQVPNLTIKSVNGAAEDVLTISGIEGRQQVQQMAK